MELRLLLSVFLLLFVAAPCYAEVPAAELDKTVAEISGQVLSPFCPGRALSDCPSNKASELKQQIRERLVAGQSKEEVYEYLYTLYGDDIRAAPEFSSFGLVAWLAPAFFLLLGFGAILIWLKRNQLNGSTTSDDELLF